MRKKLAVLLTVALIPLSGAVACGQAIEDRARDEVNKQVENGRQRVNEEIDKGQKRVQDRVQDEITNAQDRVNQGVNDAQKEAEKRTGGTQ